MTQKKLGCKKVKIVYDPPKSDIIYLRSLNILNALEM